jgi:hypothetical protein
VDCGGNSTLSIETLFFKPMVSKLLLVINTDNSDPTMPLVKLATIFSLVGLIATKYPGFPDLILYEQK